MFSRAAAEIAAAAGDSDDPDQPDGVSEDKIKELVDAEFDGAFESFVEQSSKKIAITINDATDDSANIGAATEMADSTEKPLTQDESPFKEVTPKESLNGSPRESPEGSSMELQESPSKDKAVEGTMENESLPKESPIDSPKYSPFESRDTSHKDSTTDSANASVLSSPKGLKEDSPKKSPRESPKDSPKGSPQKTTDDSTNESPKLANGLQSSSMDVSPEKPMPELMDDKANGADDNLTQTPPPR